MKNVSVNYNSITIIMACELVVKKSNGSRIKCVHFTFLKRMFNNFFKGEHFLKGIEFTEKDKRLYERLDVEFKFYIELYTIVNFNWFTIEEILSVIDVTDGKYKFERPGDVLAYLLMMKHKRWNDKLTKNKTDYEYLYKAWCEYIKSKNNKKLTNKCETLINRLKKRTTENKNTSEGLLLDVILEVIPKTDSENLKRQKYLLDDHNIRMLRHMF